MAHEPIQFHNADQPKISGEAREDQAAAPPRAIDLKKDTALTVTWSDGRVSIYPIRYLRRMSPSADARVLREEMKKNPLTVIPPTMGRFGSSKTGGHELTATGAELVGNYALRVRFSDGHDTGIYSWGYLRGIDPGAGKSEEE